MTTKQQPGNLLPYDGETLYFGKVLTLDQAQHYYDILMATIRWKHDEAVIFGKHIITKRKVAWYGEAGFEYTYSNTTKSAIEWTHELLELKRIVEKISGTTFNSCLLNLYHDGDEGVSWHSDNEKALGTNTIIASISLGAERKFMFKHKNTKETIPVFLENGSLLVMQGETQQHWLHSIPKTKKISTPRINLTFRKFIG
ncbi:MAG TPA: alpha-ketoglutarate-dependent dioxygenase AlkB [Flavobacterium sp.]|jgi:alkylated DNA repair dioxygenase AlkB|nr:alpha-ketoglutarate-dependent dioxygenase AlkB [Flavobacterium sp.]